MDDIDDDDIYSGLGGAEEISSTQASYAELADRVTHVERKNDELESKVKKLEEQNATLTKQNLALKRNISCLYKTAKAEIDRKDARLKELRDAPKGRGSGRR